MLHSDLRNWGKNILLLQKKHMITKLSGCHTGFCAGDGVLSQSHFGNPHCFDGHAYVKVYTPYTDVCFVT